MCLPRTLALWSIVKKKPLVMVHHVEQRGIPLDPDLPPSWVSAVAALPNTDLIASGMVVCHSTASWWWTYRGGGVLVDWSMDCVTCIGSHHSLISQPSSLERMMLIITRRRGGFPLYLAVLEVIHKCIKLCLK